MDTKTVAKEHSILTPDRAPRPNFFIDERLANEVTLHIIKNSARRLNPPLILAVQGPKGEGKSQTIREICSRIGVTIIALAGSAVSGGQEKEPLLAVRDAYVEGSVSWISRKQPAVLLIDDIDTSTAAVQGDRRYGVNTQLVSGALMHLCDDPYNVGDRRTARVPIIVTGNNFTTLYGPLMRRGRMRFFDWVPDIATKFKIVEAMFDDILPKQELRFIPELVREFSREPIAFYDELKNDLLDMLIMREFEHQGGMEINALHAAINSMQIRTSFRELMRVAMEKQAQTAQNYNNDDRTVVTPPPSMR